MNITAMPNKDFLEPLLDLMNKRMDSLEAKVDANTQVTTETLAQAKHTNSRVTKLEKRMAKVELTRGRKLNIDPKLLYTLATALVLLLAIVAAKAGVNTGSLGL